MKAAPGLGRLFLFKIKGLVKELGWLRAGLSKVARKFGSAWPAGCGGDLGSPRKAAGAATAKRGLPAKARYPP